MSIPPITPAPTSPPAPSAAPIPLTPALRAAYQDLLNDCETAIEASADPAVLEPLMDSRTQVDDLLTKDAMYQLEQNTALFEQLELQFHDANKSLKVLKGELAAIGSKVATIGTVIAGIDKVLALTGVL